MPRLKRHERYFGTYDTFAEGNTYVTAIATLGPGETLLRTRVDVFAAGITEIGVEAGIWNERSVQMVSALGWSQGGGGPTDPTGFFTDLAFDWTFTRQHVFETTTVFENSLDAVQTYTFWNSTNSQTLDSQSMRACGEDSGAAYLVHDIRYPFPVESLGFALHVNWVSYALILTPS